MKFMKATGNQIPEIMEIIFEAQAYFKAHGIDQWQNGYPNLEKIEADIENGNSYIVKSQDKVVATAVLEFGGEPNYEKIYEGAWKSSHSYAALHRIAVSNKYKGQGLASFIIKEMEKICLEREVKSIRVDTHEDNLAMQKMLRKNNFKYCSKIFLADGSPRLAFERILSEN